MGNKWETNEFYSLNDIQIHKIYHRLPLYTIINNSNTTINHLFLIPKNSFLLHL